MLPSPLKEIPLLDRVSERTDPFAENFGRSDVSLSQATAATSMMEEACKSCGKDVAKLWSGIEKIDITFRGFVDNENFKDQDHYEAKIRLMSHEHSESVASMQAAHLRAIEKVERACHGKTETCQKHFREQMNRLTHLMSTLSYCSSHALSTILSHFCDSQCSCIVEFRKPQSNIETGLTGIELVNATIGQEGATCSSSVQANENVTNSLRSLLQDRANVSSSNEQHARIHELATGSGAVGFTSGGNRQCRDDCPLSCSCRTDMSEVRNNLEASIGTHKDKFRQLRTSSHELCDELVGLSREHTIKHQPMNSASPSSIAALTLEVFIFQWEVAAVRLAIEGCEQEGVDEAKEFSVDEFFQICSSGRSERHANCRTRSVESLSLAFYGRGQDNTSKRSNSAPCAAKRNFLGVVGDNLQLPSFPAHKRFIVTSHKASYPPWMCQNS